MQVADVRSEVLTPTKLEDFRLAVRLIAAASSDGVSVMAELLAHGIKKFGEAEVKAVLSDENLPRPFVENSLVVAKQPKQVRHFKIPIQFRLAVARAGLSGAQAARWLKIAVDREMNIRDFTQSIATGKVVDPGVVLEGSFTAPLIENLSISFKRWFAQAIASEPIEKWDRERLLSLREELKPMADLAKRIDELI